MAVDMVAVMIIAAASVIATVIAPISTFRNKQHLIGIVPLTAFLENTIKQMIHSGYTILVLYHTIAMRIIIVLITFNNYCTNKI